MITLNKSVTIKNPDPLALLKKRVAQNYADFKADMLMQDEEEIFDRAHRIAAVKDTYEQLTREDFYSLTEDEASFLLTFHNPLELVTDFLDGRVVEDDVDDALEEALNAEGLEDFYLTESYAKELMDKYGDAANIKNALLMETIEAGKRYLRLMKLTDTSCADDFHGGVVLPYEPLGFDVDGFFIYEDDGEGCF